jgi:N-glycosylase/DNA lyase
MSQLAGIVAGHLMVQVELPAADDEVMPGVAWGAVEAFPTPAYWAYQVLARRVMGTTIQHKLGRDLSEEVAACLLGGHGIPSEVGLAAFRRLRDAGVFHESTSEAEIFRLLSEPLALGDRSVRYRFAAQKSRYLNAALEMLRREAAPMQSGRALRDWLVQLPGIGLKTASWVARNLMDADDVAILDIHILRAGRLGGFFNATWTVEKNYLRLEERFIEFSTHLKVRPSELDSVIWLEMKMSPRTVHRLLEDRSSAEVPPPKRSTQRRPSANKRSANAEQALLFK